MSKKIYSLILMIAGLLLAVLSLIADFIYIYSYPGIHWAQLTGIGVGLAAFILGFWKRTSKEKEK